MWIVLGLKVEGAQFWVTLSSVLRSEIWNVYQWARLDNNHLYNKHAGWTIIHCVMGCKAETIPDYLIIVSAQSKGY